MNFFSNILLGVFLLSIVAPLSAGELIIYGGTQKPVTTFFLPDQSLWGGVDEDIEGDFGSTFGIRYSAGRVIGFEQGIGYSPKFAKPGVKAFQTDSNLLIQAPGKVAPYGTVGIGLVRLWGEDIPTLSDPAKIASFVFGSAGSNFAINYGGGLKIRRLGGPLGINIDVRGYTLPGVKVNYVDQTAVDIPLSFIQTTAGLVFTW